MPPPSVPTRLAAGDADVGELDDRVLVAGRVRIGRGTDHGDTRAGQVDQEQQVLGGRFTGGRRRPGAGSGRCARTRSHALPFGAGGS